MASWARWTGGTVVRTILFLASVAILEIPWACAEPLTAMPAYPTDPKDYISKWDPSIVPPLTGAKETLSQNNGRQIARDSTGAWFVLLERDQQSIYLGRAVERLAKGGDFEILELVGSSQAVFQGQGSVLGAGMVIDRRDNLHVIWCSGGAVYAASRDVKGVTFPQLREKSAWTGPKRLATRNISPSAKAVGQVSAMP